LSRRPEGQFLDMSFLFPSSGQGKPESAVIVQFPPRGRFDVRVVREALGPGWLVLTHDRGHSWVHGDFNAALHDAVILAAGYRVAVQSSAWRSAP
jgi:hypothetical protein